METALSLPPLVITFLPFPPFPSFSLTLTLPHLTADVFVACVGYFMITVNYTIAITTTITNTLLQSFCQQNSIVRLATGQEDGQFVPGNWRTDLLTAKLHTLQHTRYSSDLSCALGNGLLHVGRLWRIMKI